MKPNTILSAAQLAISYEEIIEGTNAHAQRAQTTVMMATHDRSKPTTMTCCSNQDHSEFEEHGSRHEEDDDKAEGHEERRAASHNIQRVEHHEDHTREP